MLISPKRLELETLASGRSKRPPGVKVGGTENAVHLRNHEPCSCGLVSWLHSSALGTLSISSLSPVTTAIKFHGKLRAYMYVAIVDQTVAWPSRQNCCRPSAYGGHSQQDWTASTIMKMSYSPKSMYESQVIRKSVQIHASSVAIVVLGAWPAAVPVGLSYSDRPAICNDVQW